MALLLEPLQIIGRTPVQVSAGSHKLVGLVSLQMCVIGTKIIRLLLAAVSITGIRDKGTKTEVKKDVIADCGSIYLSQHPSPACEDSPGTNPATIRSFIITTPGNQLDIIVHHKEFDGMGVIMHQWNQEQNQMIN